MLTLNQFRNLIFNVVALLTLVSAILTGMLEYKSWTQAPDILVQQSKFDGVNDRIVKTKGNLKDLDVIFIAPNIQDFESTKNQVLVTTGVENQESQLQLIDIKTKIIKPLKYPAKFVGQIAAGSDKFVILVEDLKNVNGQNLRTYKSKLAMITEENQEVIDLNPQFLATQVDSIFINPSGSLLIFRGVGSGQYLLDLNDINNISLLNSSNAGINYGFVNDTEIYFSDYSISSETRIKFFDVTKDEVSFVSLLSESLSQLAISPDKENIYYTQNKDVKGENVKSLKNYKTSYTKFDPNYSFDNIKISPKDLFILFEKLTTGLQYRRNKDFAIYNLKAMYLPADTIVGVKAIWVK